MTLPFSDPAYMAAHRDTRSIRIEKLSSDTLTGCVCGDVLKFLGRKPWGHPEYVEESIGINVWRVKIGRGRGGKIWVYGNSLVDALSNAYKNEVLP
jgi:hypothetical protein